MEHAGLSPPPAASNPRLARWGLVGITLLLIVIAVIVGLPEAAMWFLYGAGVVTVLSLGKLCILWNHRLKGRYEQARQDWTATKGNLDKATEEYL